MDHREITSSKVRSGVFHLRNKNVRNVWLSPLAWPDNRASLFFFDTRLVATRGAFGSKFRTLYPTGMHE